MQSLLPQQQMEKLSISSTGSQSAGVDDTEGADVGEIHLTMLYLLKMTTDTRSQPKTKLFLKQLLYFTLAMAFWSYTCP